MTDTGLSDLITSLVIICFQLTVNFAYSKEIWAFKIENASTFSRGKSQFPPYPPPVLITCTHPRVTLSLSLSPPPPLSAQISSHQECQDTEATLAQVPASGSGSGQPTPPGFYCDSIYSAMRLTHTLTSAQLTPVSALSLTTHFPIPPSSRLPSSFPPTLQPILTSHLNDELG